MSITCSGANPNDIVAWIREFISSNLVEAVYMLFKEYLFYTAEGVDPSTIGTITNLTSSDPFCMSPEPFIRNTNTNYAVLMSDEFNGTLPEHAGNYTCYTNGIPRDTIEIVVLGKYISYM